MSKCCEGNGYIKAFVWLLNFLPIKYTLSNLLVSLSSPLERIFQLRTPVLFLFVVADKRRRVSVENFCPVGFFREPLKVSPPNKILHIITRSPPIKTQNSHHMVLQLSVTNYPFLKNWLEDKSPP